MSEPIHINDLDQLADIVVEVTIKLPDGREAIVKVKSLPASEVAAIRRRVTWPQPPVKDYKKFGNEATPIYDYNDAAYKAADESADQELARRMLVACLDMNIGGDTVDEKCATLEKKLGQAAYICLINAVNRINTPQAEDIAAMMRSFRPVGTAGTSGNGQAGAYPVTVEKLVEARSDRDAGVSADTKRKAPRAN